MKLQTKISELNSSELLQYSQEIHKERLSHKVEDYLIILDLIESRRKIINKGRDIVCENAKMVRDFKRGGK